MNTVLKRIFSLFIGAVLAFGFFAPSAAAAASAVGSNAGPSAVRADASWVNDAALGVSVPSATAAARTSAASEYPALPSKSEIAAMSKFDGREYGIVTPVKDQGSTNLCWAYSSVAASESSILISKTDPTATPESLNLNPTAAAYRIMNRTSDPLNNTNGEYVTGDFTAATGNPAKIATLFSQWWGPVSSNNAQADPFENSRYRLENAVLVSEHKYDAAKRISAIKAAVAEYGAVTFQYNNAHNVYYYNPKNETGSQSYPHACTIIGWDDSIPADSFSPGGATQNGGWLIKNSYSSLPDGYPYFYISYDNTSSYTYAFSYAVRDKYDNNYYYDGLIDDFPLRNDKYVANVYKAAGTEAPGKSEMLRAVNVGVTGTDYTLEVEIYKNLSSPYGTENAPTAGGESVYKTSAHFAYGGYVTVPIDGQISLSAGEWFSVIVRITAGSAKIRLCGKNGKNLSYAGTSYGFSEMGNYVGRIKALTKICSDPDDKQPTFTNLVVLAKFSDEAEFINDVYEGASVKQIIDNTYNRAAYSVRDYFASLSNGKAQVRTLFLFDGNGSVTLSKPRGYYAEKDEFNPGGYDPGQESLRSAELRGDWADAVNAAVTDGNRPTDIYGNTYAMSELDKNGDGKIDCITVIYKPTTQNISVGWSAPLWDHKFYNTLISASENGKTIFSDAYVQLTLSYATASGDSVLYRSDDGLPITSLGKICHETLHVFGLRDLYRSDLSSEVYFMSAMGKPISPVAQYISVKERESLGFLGEDELSVLSRNGTYTLKAAAPYSEGVVGYKLEIPDTGKTLYLEYRNFEGSVNKYDTKSKTLYSCRTGELIKGQTLKSGLVCYLAKSGVRFPSNMGSTNEYVVVSNGIYGTKSDSAVGPGESLDIAGGITVTVTGLTETELQFEIEGVGESAHTHDLRFVEAVSATCTQTGLSAHYVCAGCGAYFATDDTNNPVDRETLVLPVDPTAHDYANGVCTRCGAKEPGAVYTLTTDAGTTEHRAGDTVRISAEALYTDNNVRYRFVGWSGDTKVLGDPGAAQCEFVMPARNITLKKNYIGIGDVDGDGIVNAIDLNLMRRAAVGLYDRNDSMDINADGGFNAIDIILFRRMLIGLYTPQK